ncbi:hypothetical protein DPMN_049710 [Dreissena polymorpha]|uniref:Uncharacterized protein n=1 Tax=Dreissena polymorpha TaxID=45954 RepID=A0A9D4HKP2_DREPO|nr:hypothetical protein DPMN_049710 [Dreissena polymorpha]
MEELSTNRLWRNGPKWLEDTSKALIKTTNTKYDVPTIGTQSEKEGDTCIHLKATEETEKNASVNRPFDIFESDFSSVLRLLRVTAYALRFVKEMKNTKV